MSGARLKILFVLQPFDEFLRSVLSAGRFYSANLSTSSLIMDIHSSRDRRVIVVDLDGTLVRSDMLVECLFLFARAHPFQLFLVFLWVLQGKVQLKRKLADRVQPDPVSLPYNNALIEWLLVQRESGAFLVLATASDIRIARAIAKHLALFDDVLGSEGHNLAALRKRDVLIKKYGESGFEYVGNSNADVPVWRASHVSHLAEPEIGVLRNFQS